MLGAVLGCATLAAGGRSLAAGTNTSLSDRQMPQLATPTQVPSGVLSEVWLIPDVGPARPITLRSVPVGGRFSAEMARRAMRELLATGQFASMRAETSPAEAGGVRLELFAVERKIVADVQVNGAVLELDQTLNTAGVRMGEEITRPALKRAAARVWQLYKDRGFPEATVSGSWSETEQPRRVTVILTIAPGRERTVASLEPSLPDGAHRRAVRLASDYAVAVGQRADSKALDAADQELLARLRAAGFWRAQVSHTISGDARAHVRLSVNPGPQLQVRFEGLRAFDSAALHSAIEAEADSDISVAGVRGKLLEYYERHGFFDTRVRFTRVGSADGAREDWLFSIAEGQRLRVASRFYPCLGGVRSVAEVDAEIDGILAEQLPGGETILAPTDPGIIDQGLGGAKPGNSVTVPQLEPWTVFSPTEYERALTHLQDLYRSEGYLSATVGPVALLRRQCDPTTGPQVCRPIGQRSIPVERCPTADTPQATVGTVQLGVDESAPASVTCRQDPRKGIRCESTAMLSIPVKLGPRTTLWDVEFRGNRLLVDKELFEVAELRLGEPLSQIELQRARRRLGETYGDRGFAFAQVDVDVELSQDQTRGKARFVISEREPVRIRSFVVRGAEQTRESLIFGRLALKRGGLYRRDLARQSEEQLASLGVFSSVTIELEDPDVPAREKVVVVSVQERPSQYVDIKPGFSTGEGFRIGLEYGHRNVFGRAWQLRLRVQLGYLPGALIIQGDVRRSFEALSFTERLERRNSATIEVPLAQRFRLALDGIDVRDNSREFGLTKRAAIVTVTHRLARNLSWLAGTSIEDNDVTLFNETDTLYEYLELNPQYARLLNVPEGRSFAVAFRLGGAWDGTDNPLGATRGAFVSVDAEPVVAFLDKDSPAVELSQCEQENVDKDACEYRSRFLKLATRVAGYIPFNNKGLSLALSLRVGANLQLVDRSITYPDRLFFLGGSDSLRGYLQDNVIPEDIGSRLSAETAQTDASQAVLTARQVVIRGGDVVINPRIELRIPLTKLLQTALFLDAGNVWREIDNVQPWILRYAAGTGLRVATPVGPLAFDYGFRLDRRLYEPDDLGAFHFSVGLF